MSWASWVTRAGTRPAGSGLAAVSTSAGPLIPADMANFIKVHVDPMPTGPPSVACNGRYILLGLLEMPLPFLTALYITSRLHARGGRAVTCSTTPARDSSQKGAGGKRMRRMTREEFKKDDSRGQESSMKEEDLGYMNEIVGVVVYLLEPGFATTSTISACRRGSCGSAVAAFCLAAGFAPTPFPRLAACTSLAVGPTTGVCEYVPGVARSVLPTRLWRQTAGTFGSRPLALGATASVSKGVGRRWMHALGGWMEMGSGGSMRFGRLQG